MGAAPQNRHTARPSLEQKKYGCLELQHTTSAAMQDLPCIAAPVASRGAAGIRTRVSVRHT